MPKIVIVQNDSAPKIEISKTGNKIAITQKGHLMNLPIATDTTLGGVIVGSTLSVDVTGLIDTVPLGVAGGWLLADDAIYTGTKHITDGFSLDGITLASDGSIHAENFYINVDGTVGIKDLGYSYTNTGKILINGDELSNPHNYPGKQGYIKINETIYDASQNITVLIGDGQGNTLFALNTPADGDIVSLVEHVFQAGFSGVLTAKDTLTTEKGRVKNITSVIADTNLTGNHHIVIGNNTNNITVYFPATPVTGQEYIIKRLNSGTLTVNGNGKNIVRIADVVASWAIDNYHSWTFVYDGTVWLVISNAA